MMAVRRPGFMFCQRVEFGLAFNFPIDLQDPASLPTLASVVYVRIAEFTRRPVAEQARLRAQLEAGLAVALADSPARSRIVLDAPDGMAVAVLRDPVAALNIAERCAAVSTAGVSLAIAVNHGAIRLAADDTGRTGLIGDAIGSAAAIAGYTDTFGVTVSRSFRDALAEADPARANCLRRAGVFTDSQVRPHELLTPDRSAMVGRRRMLLVFGVLITIALVAAAAVFRDSLRREFFAGQPAAIAFDLKPDGEVFLNGVYKGKSPPLSELRVDAGTHAIEVRKARQPAYKTELELAAGETFTVRHAFGPAEESGFFGRLLDSLKSRASRNGSQKD